MGHIPLFFFGTSHIFRWKLDGLIYCSNLVLPPLPFPTPGLLLLFACLFSDWLGYFGERPLIPHEACCSSVDAELGMLSDPG